MPRWARRTAGGYIAVLLWGTGVHVADLVAGGTDPYPWAPPWLATYFVALTVADPIAAALLVGRRRLGMDLACLILVTDAAANGWAVYGLPAGEPVARIGHAMVAMIALGSMVARQALRPHLAPLRSHDPAPAGALPVTTAGATAPDDMGQRRTRGTWRR
ncbi:hypothetical protein GA0074695_4872 [Micromonospora viridifaciens]|uniref:Uncharacterized protein n=1 Tax=Micromonospora viridifaciens TaxID=1881 RepID=A0A1C4YYK6_MICVI|nr:hypothetical protein [Micromonospora viridifaciens]SCF25780.1 hypothetical protein GA0074695_4872 [Micromonospora viridifaciens]